MVKTYNMGTGAAADDAPQEEITDPNAGRTDPIGTPNDGADQAVIDERLKPVFNYFDAKSYNITDREDGATVYELLDIEGNPLAGGSLIELEGFVAQDVLKKGDSNDTDENQGAPAA